MYFLLLPWEFELFLFQLDTNRENATSPTLSEFLKFAAAVDRVPINGLGKVIEIFFVHQNRMPTASTCGLYMTVPVNVTVSMLMKCITEGGTFGIA